MAHEPVVVQRHPSGPDEEVLGRERERPAHGVAAARTLGLEDADEHRQVVGCAQSDRRRAGAHAGSREPNSAMTDLLASHLLISVGVYRICRICEALSQEGR
jgi:hypothetical protein